MADTIPWLPSGGPPLTDSKPNILEELAELRTMVQQISGEVIAVRHPLATEDRISTAEKDLKDALTATEGAANGILEGAEAIGALAEELEKTSQDPAVQARAGKIGELVTDLFTHCSFQDLAGQRINKVVTTLRLIDEKIEAMIGALGEGALAEMPVPGQLAADDDKRLLGGPRTDGASQDEIDRLFG